AGSSITQNSPQAGTAPGARQSKKEHSNKPAVKSSKGQSSQHKRPASNLPPIIVVLTPTGMPQPLGEVGTTTSVVSQKQAQIQQSHDLPDLLQQVPGVQVTQSGSPGTVADVSIRGSTPAQTLIMIDGVPVNDAATGQFDISRIPTDGLERVEIVRGAGGALYGSQAIGGVVNLFTQEGSGPFKFSLLSQGGNRATERQVGQFDGAIGRLAYAGTLYYFSTTGFRPVNDNSDNLSGVLRLDYHLDEDTTLRVNARYTRSNVSLASFSTASGIALNPTAHQRNEFMLYKGEIDHAFGRHLMTRASAFYVRDELRVNNFPFAGSPISESDRIPDETRGGILDGIYTWSQRFRSLAGFSFLDHWAHSQSSIFALTPPVSQSLSVFNARRQEYAGYVEQEGHFLDDHLIATGGFRVDGNSQFGEEVSPGWSLAIPLPYQLTLRGSYAEGFRAPSFDELYFPGFGNPNLGPEISSEYDGGITKRFGEIASFTTTYFSRRVHHLIVTVPCTVGPGCEFGATAGNAGRVDTQGVEFVPTLYPGYGLRLSGSVTILDETHVSPAPDIRPERVPKYSASALAEYHRHALFRAADNLTLAVIYVFVGDRDDITPAGTIANHDAYHRFDLAFTYSSGVGWRKLNNVDLVAKIQNLLDRHYSESFGFPAPPVNFVAGVKLEFQ
ncbi:MAG TPA: TonB-dependent receptor, partial [Candidatus Binataceae bacterium]|nr:TonB-dependent receptor [Candidatus Binataceae bacterium]